MSYLLDTNVCSDHLRKAGRVTSQMLQHTGRLHFSTVSLGELLSWILRVNTPESHRKSVEEMLEDMIVLEVDEAVGRKFGEVQSALLDKGERAPGMDLLIAATALVHDLTLVTHNTDDFERIPDLRVVDWR